MTPVRQLGATDIAIIAIVVYLVHLIIKRRLAAKGATTTTPLNGPLGNSRLFGVTRDSRFFPDPGRLYEEWAEEYGAAYTIPMALGMKKTVLLDPKAISNFYSKETTVYHGTPFSKRFIARIFGRGLLWAEGESHRRQRKALTPAFSNAALRRLTAVFYDSVYKLKTHWDSKLENHPDGEIIEVQEWMNHVALDSIGIAGFSHDFGSLDGKPSGVVEAFESLGTAPPTRSGRILFLLSFVFPWLFYVPTERTTKLLELRKSMNEIANEMLSKSRRVGEDNSIIGLLIKAENTGGKGEGELHMTAEEVSAQMNVLLLAGYETTSISLTWALVELSKAPAKQDILRKELLGTKGGQDAQWDDLMASDKYPYLDAVVHEVLRLHPPLAETTRVATEDDVLPLTAPIITKDGREVSTLTIAKGTTVSAPISCMNRSELVWGKKAKEFIPERWMDSATASGFDELEVEVIPASAKEIQGYRHLLTFSDGPRTCLGKNFALSEFKAVLSVLIKNYRFELTDGPETKIELARGILPRPKVEGALGPKVPMRVRKVEVD
ncbi:cytochrome P450 [Marasmius fiardii PR-910]|nr:cytochrome P450 [Marasmius fiardii PR-910]